MDLMRSVSTMALAIGASLAMGTGVPAHATQTVSFNLNAPTSSSSGAFDSEGVNQLALPNLSMSQIKHLRPSNL